MKSGVYRHKVRKNLTYLLIGVAQNHENHEKVVVYVPLFKRSGWEDTPIMTFRPLDEFVKEFEWASDYQPK